MPGIERTEGDQYGVNKAGLAMFAFIGLLILAFAIFIWIWFFCRINVPKGQFVPLLKKTGKNMTNEMVLAGPEFRGPQFEVLKDGRHFRNPYAWWWPSPQPATTIEQGKVGIMIRKYGKPLDEGQVVAEEDDQKGIVREPLRAGRYYLNTWGYDVEVHAMVRIEPGHRGIVTLIVGKRPRDPNVFVVADGERGTQPFTLPPGDYPKYSNPYIYRITPIDVRSQKFEMAGKDAITFPSKYGFDIRVEGTIEWAPHLEQLPELFVKYVDESDLKQSGGIRNIQQKIILTFARSYFRLIGGEHRAVDYITGEARIKVQKSVEERLKETCAKQGIEIRSFVIRATDPPTRIREQYERREIARREMERYKKEIETEIGTVVMKGATPKKDKDGQSVLDEAGRPVMVGGKPALDDEGRELREGGRLTKVIQERRKDREQKFGGVRVEIVTEIRAAEQYQAVEVTKAERQLAVAKVRLEAAKDHAAKILAEGTAAAEVTVMKNKAEAEAVKAKVLAFGDGSKYAEWQLIMKMSPGITRILSNTEGSFARLFERFSSQKEGGAKPASPKK